MRAVVLRPEPGASATAARIRAQGGEAIIAPIFQITRVGWMAPEPSLHDALVLTSANAARHAGPGLAALASLRVFAVGAATAEAARRAGLTVAHVGAGDGDALFATVAAGGASRPLHLVGADHKEATQRGLNVTRVIVYRADPLDRLPSAAIDALKLGAVALLHSPRAAASFARLANRVGLGRSATRIAAISAAAAEAAGEGWRALAVAPVPTDDALLAAAARLCETGVWPHGAGV